MKADNNIATMLEKRFPALTHRDYAIFWAGQCVSLTGSWMQTVAQSWLVLTITNSPYLLGIVTTLQMLPLFVFSAFTGVVADRYPKKRIVIITQTGMMTLALLLSFLYFSGMANFTVIAVFAFLHGTFNSFEMPARNSMAIELTSEEHLTNAVALNSAVFNLTRVAGPAVAGVVIGIVGVGWCFFINGASFIPVIIGLYFIKQTNPSQRQRKSVYHEIVEGVGYITQTPALFYSLVFMLVVNVFAFNHNVLIPVFARSVLNQNENGYGMLLSFVGIGALLGAFMMTQQFFTCTTKKIMMYSSFVIAVSIIATSMSKSFAAAAFFIAVHGCSNAVCGNVINSVLQLKSDSEHRGRTMSIHSLIIGLSMVVGNYLSGVAVSSFGAAGGYGIIGVGAFISLVLFFMWTKTSKKVVYQD